MAAYYDFFRKILLQPDGITLEADSVEDTLTITGGNGVSLNPNATNFLRGMYIIVKQIYMNLQKVVRLL